MARLRRTPGLRLVLLLALLPLAALPWLGQRFVETVAGVARDVQLDNLQVAARGLAATLQDRLDLLDPADGLGLPAGVEAISSTPISRPPAGRDGGGWADADSWNWRPLPVKRFGTAPRDTLLVDAAILREGHGASARRWLVVKARDERLVLPGDLGGPGGADGAGGAAEDPLAATVANAAGDSLTVTAGSADDWAQLVASDQLARAEAGALELPAERRRYPVPLVAIDEARAGHPGWQASLELADGARLIRIEIEDVDYIGTRRLEAGADSGWWLLVETDDRDAGLAAAALLEARRANVLRIFDQVQGDIQIHAADGRLLAERARPSAGLPPPQGWAARLARWTLGIGAVPVPESAAPPGVGAGRTPYGQASPDTAAPALAGALAGVPASASTPVAMTGGLPVWRLTAAQPIWVDGAVGGALVIEDSTLSRAATGLATIESLSGLVLLAFGASVLAVLGVATLTVRRIARLRRAAEEAIDARGRVVGSVPIYRWHDEVGLLAQSHARVLERLREHQAYLTRLRSWLAHELRTPVMVVRSSLENLMVEADPRQGTTPSEGAVTGAPDGSASGGAPGSGSAHASGASEAVVRYGRRALDGAARLEQILSAMSAAASLESMLESQDLAPLDLVRLGRECIDGYAMAYPDHRWTLVSSETTAPVIGVVDAIGQALDKLAANAADFAPAGSTIVLAIDAEPGLRAGAGHWRIVMGNDGPPLPEGDLLALFESLVSVRPRRQEDGAPGHLGLGLHLVRLIAEFHGGRVLAGNRPGGVCLGFTLPSA